MFWLFLENKVIFQFLSKKFGFHLRSTLALRFSMKFQKYSGSSTKISNLQRTETLEVTATILDPIEKDGKLENCEFTFHRLRLSKLFASFRGEIR